LIVISRKEAISLGLSRYFTGKPCGNGHIAERIVCDHRCVECRRQASRLRYAADPEKHRKIRKDSYRKNPEKARAATNAWRVGNPDKVREQKRRYATKHSEKLTAKTAAWVAQNPNQAKLSKKRWAAENRDKAAESSRISSNVYYAKKRGAGGHYETDDIHRLFLEQSGVCLCGKSLNDGYHIDHIIPVSRGGTTWPSNLQLLCPRCNLSKGSKTMEEWRPVLQEAV